MPRHGDCRLTRAFGLIQKKLPVCLSKLPSPCRNGISAPLSPTERALPTDSAGVRVDSRVLCGR